MLPLVLATPSYHNKITAALAFITHNAFDVNQFP
jgi:hypothetical protein